MRKALLALCMIVPLYTPTSVVAQNNGNDLLEYCTAQPQESYFRAGQCLGFINGVTTTSTNLGCVPEGVTRGQAKDIVIRYLQQNPQRRHLGSSLLVEESFRNAFPCGSRR
jgi:hypothetical protein